MAARPWSLTALSLALSWTVWAWMLAAALIGLKWNSIERPGLPVRQIFPYGELRIGVDASNPPFAVATADDLFGLEIDLGRALAERIGIPLRFVNMGYDGLYDAIRADQVDIVISTLIVDSLRTGDVRYTRPYFDAGYVLVSTSENRIEAMSALPGRALAYEFGSEADALARLWLRRVNPFETRAYEMPGYALDAVRLGEADAALVDATSARLYLRAHDRWPALLSYVTHNPYVIASRIDRWQTWATIDQALQALEADGSMAEIIARWL